MLISTKVFLLSMCYSPRERGFLPFGELFCSLGTLLFRLSILWVFSYPDIGALVSLLPQMVSFLLGLYSEGSFVGRGSRFSFNLIRSSVFSTAKLAWPRASAEDVSVSDNVCTHASLGILLVRARRWLLSTCLGFFASLLIIFIA